MCVSVYVCVRCGCGCGVVVVVAVRVLELRIAERDEAKQKPERIENKLLERKEKKPTTRESER